MNFTPARTHSTRQLKSRVLKIDIYAYLLVSVKLFWVNKILVKMKIVPQGTRVDYAVHQLLGGKLISTEMSLSTKNTTLQEIEKMI